VWYEDGERQQCQSVSEEKLAAELEKVKVRLQADAPNMRRPGADLIAYYLNPDRLPPDGQWSRKHHRNRNLSSRSGSGRGNSGLMVVKGKAVLQVTGGDQAAGVVAAMIATKVLAGMVI
jgi:hypothetical protein